MAVEISNWNEFVAIDPNSNQGGTYVLTNDLDKDTTGYDNVGVAKNSTSGYSAPELEYNVTFDGQNNKIADAYINNFLIRAGGQDNFEFKNVTLENINTTGSGILFREIRLGSKIFIDNITFDNCSVTGLNYEACFMFNEIDSDIDVNNITVKNSSLVNVDRGDTCFFGNSGSLGEDGEAIFSNILVDNCKIVSEGSYVCAISNHRFDDPDLDEFTLENVAVLNTTIRGGSNVSAVINSDLDDQQFRKEINNVAVINCDILSTYRSSVVSTNYLDQDELTNILVLNSRFYAGEHDNDNSPNADYGTLKLLPSNGGENVLFSGIKASGSIIDLNDSIGSVYVIDETTNISENDFQDNTFEYLDYTSNSNLSLNDVIGNSASSNLSEFDFTSVWKTVNAGPNGIDSYPILRTIDEEAQYNALSNSPYIDRAPQVGSALSGTVEKGGTYVEGAIVFSVADGNPPIPKAVAETDANGNYNVSVEAGRNFIGVVYDDETEKWGRAKSIDYS